MLALIALLVPALLPMFVLADRIGRFVAMAVSPLLQVFQGWVPAASGRELVRRIRISGWVALATAVVAGGAYTASLPSFSELLTHGQVGFGVSATIAFGLNMTMAILSPYLTNVGLMTVGKVRAVAVSVVAGVVTSLVPAGRRRVGRRRRLHVLGARRRQSRHDGVAVRGAHPCPAPRRTNRPAGEPEIAERVLRACLNPDLNPEQP